MRRINYYSLFPLSALAILIYLLSTQLSNIFPLGATLDPFVGVVHNGVDNDLELSYLRLDNLGLIDSVSIFFDKRKVPHIYAKNEQDLYFVQGYITARMRLWQMDFLTYVAAGRLSELFGSDLFNYDREQRRKGILQASKASLKLMELDAETKRAMNAYTKGVNAYISRLDYKHLPLEYKLMDYQPESWTNLKTVLVVKQMASTLSGNEDDFEMSRLILDLGESDFNKLYPDFYPHSSPVIIFDTSNAKSGQFYVKKPGYLDDSFLAAAKSLRSGEYNRNLGSNSWVVSGKKTQSGSPILCSDPHLGLTLPSIWIEMQLSSPEINVYGVSIPGVPSIIIGFNNNIAWGETNGTDDVKDWYKLKMSKDCRKYLMDGRWLEMSLSVEPIKIKGRKTFYDTIYHTVQGPVVYDRSFAINRPELLYHALKWQLHDSSNELLTFLKLNSAKNYEDYRDALRSYACPIQNFTFACRNDDIALTHQGKMIVKWPGMGRFILDGSSSAYLWKNYIPEDSLPAILNPSCNYIFSANQHPTNCYYPYYYSGYFSEIRANRIRELLQKSNKFSIEDMMKIQLDNIDAFAVDALPVLTKRVEKAGLKGDELKSLVDLEKWDGDFSLDSENALLFDMWWRNIEDSTWDELPINAKPDNDYILLDLIQNEPDNRYFDKRSTATRETANDIILAAFKKADSDYCDLKKNADVRWGRFNRVNISHMTNIKAFSKMGIPSAGYPKAINAISSGWGPSWRMVVQLGDRPKAFGIYPGGQSGSIGSKFYDNFVGDWNKGNYYPLNFYISKAEAKEQTNCKWLLK